MIVFWATLTVVCVAGLVLGGICVIRNGRSKDVT
jgi:hypothetical protein